MSFIYRILLAIGVVLPVQGEVIFNEIMYHAASANAREEFIELFNTASNEVSLTNWKITKGVEFAFPSNTVITGGGYLVVAAHRATFGALYAGVTNVVGDYIQMVTKNYPDRVLTNWVNTLGNSGNTLVLRDQNGGEIDSVEYANEGDWAARRRGLTDVGQRGWIWWAEHDGGGKTLELINPNMPNQYGQYWGTSAAVRGTPGRVNSIRATNIPPLLLDVHHFPIVPSSSDQVAISARIIDEQSGLTVTLFYRDVTSTVGGFNSTPMFDDGVHGDGVAGDGLYGAFILPQFNNTVIDFYVQAQDAQSNVRTWPAAALPAADNPGGVASQDANALYQVDDNPNNFFGAGNYYQPIHKMIMSGPEAAQLRAIPCSGSQNSDAEMNTTFISIDGTETLARYRCGTRNRGHGSRCATPPNYRVNFPSDDTWKGIRGLNINAVNTYCQIFGSAIALKAGVAGTESRPGRVRVNNEDRANQGGNMFGAYAINEEYGREWAKNHFPGNSGGNVYAAVRDIDNTTDLTPEFRYRGETNRFYQNTYFKHSNASEDNWEDLKGMCAVMGTNGPVPFDSETVGTVIDADQWLRHIAFMAITGNSESGINTGHNDDYYMYRGINDPRFLLTFHDLDSLFTLGYGTGDTIFGATSFPPRGPSQPCGCGVGRAMNRFMHSQDPGYEGRYYQILQDLLDTTFSQARFDALLDQTLGTYVPTGTINNTKSWMNNRRTTVQSLINGRVPVVTTLPVAVLSGDPRSPYPLQNVTITVGGEGISHYRWRPQNAGLSAETPVSTPIVLTNMAQGSTNFIIVIGRFTNGTYQSSFSPTVSRKWVVDTNWPAIRINEILARNDTAYNHAGTFPDVIELYNEGADPINISGMRLTDDPGDPNKFAFPPGTTVAGGAYLVVFANNADGTPDLHTGFNLSQSGEGVYLYQSTLNGGGLLDSVEFGIQAPDLSIGRLGSSGNWVLTQPTIGTANIAAALGNPRNLKINELLTAGTTPIADDFVEIYNPNTAAVPLGGMYMTDNAIGDRTKSRLRDLSFIGPRGFVAFTADGTTNEADHVNFHLSSDQGEVALLSSSFTTLDCIGYMSQRLNVPIGRCPDGVGILNPLPQATPGVGNWCPTGTSPPPVTVSFVASSNSWRYYTSSIDPGPTWKDRIFDDSLWSNGAAAFYNGPRPASIPETIRTTLPAATGRPITYYYRTTFTVPAGSAVTVLQFQHLIDDGAVFYLNGNDIGRFNMPQGSIIPTTPASGGLMDASYQTLPNVSLTNLITGVNVLAVETHQTVLGNADVCMDAKLDGIIATNLPTGILISEVLADNFATLLQTNITLTGTNITSPDLVEFYNPTDGAIDLSDASLTDSLAVPRRWVFPPGSVVLGKGYLVVRLDADADPSTNSSAILNTGFGLKATGDSIYLISGVTAGRTVLDAVTFGPQVADFSISRLPNISSNWSLTLPTIGATNRFPAALAGPANLKINEWMAAPDRGSDWFEIYNPEAQPVALAGLYLSDRLDMPKKYNPISPLSFIGYGTNAWLKFEADDGSGGNHAEFKLSASGEQIGIYTAAGQPIDEVRFLTQDTGVSEGRLPDGFPGTSYLRFPGTPSPGDPNFALLTNVIVNEVLAHANPPLLQDAIELHNLTALPVNIGGWWLSNAKLSPRKYQIAANTTIPANGFIVFYESQFNDRDLAPAPFSLNSVNGDDVYLSAATNNGSALTGYRAIARFDPSENGVTMGPYRNSEGFEEFVALRQPTLGSSNSYPKVGPIIITEVMYHPPDIDGTNDDVLHEFVELYNPGPGAVTLYDGANSNSWRLRDAVHFDFPPSASIPAGGYLLVVSFDPLTNPGALSAFQARYGSNSALIGPYQGKLDNSSDSVELVKPDAPNQVLGDDYGKVPYVLVDKVAYTDTFPWPMDADGLGPSLQRVSMTGYGNDSTNWIAAVPTPGPAGSPADSDHDGMSDDWENSHGFDRNNPDDAGQDADGDGATNLQEYLAGTDPWDYFRILSISNPSGTAAITFNAAQGRTYTIQYSTTLATGSWTRLLNVPAALSNGPVTLQDTGASDSQRFYRLLTPQAP